MQVTVNGKPIQLPSVPNALLTRYSAIGLCGFPTYRYIVGGHRFIVVWKPDSDGNFQEIYHGLEALVPKATLLKRKVPDPVECETGLAHPSTLVQPEWVCSQTVILQLRRFLSGSEFFRLTSTCKALRVYAKWSPDLTFRPVSLGTTGIRVPSCAKTVILDKSCLGEASIKLSTKVRHLKFIQTTPLTMVTVTSAKHVTSLEFDPMSDIDIQGAVDNFPKGLTNLVIGSQRHNIVKDLRPLRNLEKLTFSDYYAGKVLFDAPVEQLWLPDGLKHLVMGRRFIGPVLWSNGRFWKLPQGLRSLTLGEKFNGPVIMDQKRQWVLPDSLKMLTITSSMCSYDNGPDRWSLPKSLVVLRLPNMTDPASYHFVTPVSVQHLEVSTGSCSPGLFPKNLRTLVIHSFLTLLVRYIPDGTERLAVDGACQVILFGLPSTVTHLSVASCLDIGDIATAKHLTHLLLEAPFNIPLVGVKLPPCLTHLSLGDTFDQDVIEEDGARQLVLPSTLTHLSIGGNFNKPVIRDGTPWKIPDSLVFFRIGMSSTRPSVHQPWEWDYGVSIRSKFNQPVICVSQGSVTLWQLPQTMQFLDLGPSFRYRLRVRNIDWRVPLDAKTLRPHTLLSHAVTLLHSSMTDH